MDNVVSVNLGGYHSAAITEDGSLYMWGDNSYGQLGDGTTTQRNTPTKIELPKLETDVHTTYNAPIPQEITLPQQPDILSAEPKNGSFTGLWENTAYNIYAMNSKTADNPLSSGNLLYIAQMVSDENGNINAEYIANKCPNAEIFAVCALGDKPVEENAEVTMYGDANCDGGVSLADAVLIMQTLANPDNYSLSDIGRLNANVNQNGNGITNADALTIQKYKLKLIDKLPES